MEIERLDEFVADPVSETEAWTWQNRLMITSGDSGRNPRICHPITTERPGNNGGFPQRQHTSESRFGSPGALTKKAILDSFQLKGMIIRHSVVAWLRLTSLLAGSSWRSPAAGSACRLQDQSENPEAWTFVFLATGSRTRCANTSSFRATDALPARHNEHTSHPGWTGDWRRADACLC